MKDYLSWKKMKRFTFIWFIHNYSYCWHKVGEALASPSFFAETMNMTSWQLHLYPKGREDPEFIALFLKRCDACNGPGNIELAYKLSFLDASGRVIETAEIDMGDFENQKNSSIGFSDFFERPENPVDGAFIADMLRVRCTLIMGDGKIERDDLCYAKTLIGVENISFIKTLKNFTDLQANNKIGFDVTSVAVDGAELSGYIYIKSEPGSEDELIMEIESPNAHLITCQMYILNLEGNLVECGKIDTRHDICRKSLLSVRINFENGNLLDKKQEYLLNDELTIRCECMLSVGIEFDRVEETFFDLHLTSFVGEEFLSRIFSLNTCEPKSVSGDLRSLLQDQILSDIRLETASKTFPAHKSILCARSPVFQAMLTTDMKEKRMDCIQVDDLEDSTIEQFLLFLYTDILEDCQLESILKLYYAADKYQVQRLKDACTAFLITGLDSQNMSDLLILADRHQDCELQTGIEKFICKRDKKIFCTDKWESFMETNPELAMKAMYHYLKNSID